MKDETFVERKFIASLHRAVEDIAPEQLEVFEKWFHPADRRPRFHIAPVIGAVGYLRKTPTLYRAVMTKAGRYASQWCCRELPQLQRRLLKSWLPPGRIRRVRRVFRRSLQSLHRDAQLEMENEDEKLVVTVTNSVFCRTATSGRNGPACIYYSSFFSGLLDCTHGHHATVTESKCRARGDDVCQFEATQRDLCSENVEVDVESPILV